MQNVISAIKDTISISLFNRGLAGKIFEDVKKTGAKIVMKNNTAECVLLSPDEYIELMDEVNDSRLLKIATQRLENLDSTTTLSATDVFSKLGITDEDTANYDEVEFE